MDVGGVDDQPDALALLQLLPTVDADDRLGDRVGESGIARGDVDEAVRAELLDDSQGALDAVLPGCGPAPRVRSYADGDGTARTCRHAALERAGFDLGDHSEESVSAAWLEVYRDADRWFELYELAEKLVDIDDALAGWRHKHVLTVERIIGNKQGTGGSAGAPYLRSTLEKRVFPELWSLRTQL